MNLSTKLFAVAALATGCLNASAASAQNQPSPDAAQHEDRMANHDARMEHHDMHRSWHGHRHCTWAWHHHHHVRVCR